MKEQTKNIGTETSLTEKQIQALVKELANAKIKLRGRIFEGKLISKDTHKSAVIEWERQIYVPKYERYMKKKSKVHAHNPAAINAQLGDLVKVVETRPISKTKNFVIIDKITK